MAKRRRLPSVMKNRFSEVPAANIRRSVFDRSHGHKTTFDAGWLIPIFLDEVLPGDTFSLKHSFICRMATPIFPLMDNLFLDIHYFYVPNRLLWGGWEEFCGYADRELYIGGGDNWPIAKPFFGPWVKASLDPSDTNPSYVPAHTVESGSLADYLGLPVGLVFPYNRLASNSWLPTEGPFISALPFLAYNQIYNEWYRDENLIPPLDKKVLSVNFDQYGASFNNFVEYNTAVVSVPAGNSIDKVGRLFRRGKRHDYFTSALPWPSKGPAVTLPIGLEAPVRGIGLADMSAGTTPGVNAFPNNITWPVYTGAGKEEIPAGQTMKAWATPGPGQQNQSARLFMEGKQSDDGKYYFPNIRADLSSATSVTINELRQAFQVQKLYERDARGGTRYIEILRSHFGVTSPDARLQRPEYLGGSSSPIHVAPVPQTSATDPKSPQGNLSAYAVANDTKRCFTKSFVEHGLILGIASVRADLTYQNGLDRMWSRKTRFDYYWPTLAHLGEQAILNQEIFYDKNKNNFAKNEEVFGYQERFAEYRYKNSLITGGMRNSAPSSYAAWHLGQNYTTQPALNQSFIEEDPPMDRVLALGKNTKNKQFIFDGYFNLKCTRPMPVYSVPGLVDHF